tara:strand:+ start:62 stop:451 length:390 start_codon:yes stop_codon:yes gene_type:complete
MKRFLLPFISFILYPSILNSGPLDSKKELLITNESTKQSIALAKHLREKGVIKYSAYWCPSCLYQSQLFGKQAYKELNVVECAPDGKNSQTQLCLDKEIQGFPSWEIDGKIIIGIQTLEDLSELTGYKK